MAPQGPGYVCKIEWVDPSDVCSKKRALAHADQESRRRRRWIQQEQLLKARKSTLETFGIAEGSPQSPQSPQSQPASPYPPSPSQMILDFGPAQGRKGSVTEHQEKAVKGSGRKGQSVDPTSKRSQRYRNVDSLDARRSSTSSTTDEIGDDGVPNKIGNRESLFADPQMWLSSSRKDPFQSMFSGLNHEEQRLVDHYMIVLPSLLFNVQKFMPFNEFTWVLASAGPLAVRSVIVTFSAAHLARLRGLKESVQSLQEKQTVIKMLQSRIEGPTGLLQKDDETISAILAITSTENQFGSPTTALLHMRAAMQLVRRRGGPQAIDHNRKLAAYVNWVDFTVPKSDGISDLPNLSSHPPQTQYPTDEANVTDPSCMHSDMEDFITFLANAQALSLQHARTNPASMPRRHSMNSSCAIFQLLLSPVDFGGRDNKRVTVHSRLATLIYLHASLWDYRAFPALSERFIQYFQTNVREQDIERNQSIVLLVWILLKMDADDAMPPPPASLLSHGAMDLDDGRSPDERRPWYVARMLRIAKLLGAQTWAKINDALLGFLDMSREGEPLLQQELGAQWTDRIRKEIRDGRAR